MHLPVTVRALAAAFALLPLHLPAQENLRDVGNDGWTQKYLTPDTVDTWRFTTAEGGLLLRAVVETSDFDATLKLVGEDDAVLASRDDDGSHSRLVFELGTPGKYRLLVHGFNQRGGGNYKIFVDRLPVQALTPGETVAGSFSRGRGWCFRFDARRGESYSFASRGADWGTFAIGPDCRELELWGNAFRVAETGPHFFRIDGPPDQRFQVAVHREPLAALAIDRPAEVDLAPGRLHAFAFAAARLDFRVLTIRHRGPVHSRVACIEEPEGKGGGAQSLDPHRGEPLVFLPVASKGHDSRHAFVVRHAGRFELHVRSAGTAADKLTVSLADPSVAIEPGDCAGRLPVGGAAFHAFAAKAGDYLALELSSPHFDPLLRLTGPEGAELAADDDGGDGLGCSLRYLVRRDGRCRVQCSSVGDGGGGEFRLALRRVEIPTIALGERKTTPCGGGTAYWHFAGRRGQRLLLSASSTTVDAGLELMAPDGVVLATDADSGIGNDSLLAVELPEDGRYTIGVSSSGSGSYELRVIEG